MSDRTLAEATAALEAAQRDLERLEADNAELAQTVAIVVRSIESARALGDYYQSDWMQDVDLVAARGESVTSPRVAGQDAAWDALAEHEELLRKLLRLTAIDVTRDVAGP